MSVTYCAVPCAAIGPSDHVMVHLIPAFIQRIKLSKPVVRTSKKLASEAVEELGVCLVTTDWDMFRASTAGLDEYTDTVTSYIHFCNYIPSRSGVFSIMTNHGSQANLDNSVSRRLPSERAFRQRQLQTCEVWI